MSPGRTANQHLPRPESWIEAERPPWLHLPAESRRISLDEVVHSIPPVPGSAVLERWVSASSANPAAVLCLLYDHDGQPHVLITRRPWTMRSHSGELSFPGGGREHGESLVETALRETEEEVGIAKSGISIVGALRPLRTFSSQRLVVPVVGLWDGSGRIAPNPDEVAEVLHVPLAHLVDDNTAWREHWAFPSIAVDVNFFDLGDDVIWGATGLMLADLFTRLLFDRIVAQGVSVSGLGDPRHLDAPQVG